MEHVSVDLRERSNRQFNCAVAKTENDALIPELPSLWQFHCRVVKLPGLRTLTMIE